MTMIRTATVLLLAASAALGLTACASPGGDGPNTGGAIDPVEDYSGLPEGRLGLPQNPSGDPQLSWLQDGAQIGITLWGSSSCPPIVESLTPTSSNVFDAAQAALPDAPCTRDLVPHTTVFETPDDTTTGSDVTIVLDGTSLTLPAL